MTEIEELQQYIGFLKDDLAAYESDCKALQDCIHKILELTADKDVKDLINDCLDDLYINMK